MGALSEKDVTDIDNHDVVDDTEVAPVEADWTEEEENRLIRRLDMIVMPLLMLSFFALQLDRGNIGNALTDFFFADVGITQDQYNVGQQMLSVGIVILEIPSNYILYRVGPTVWISFQILAWSFVATFQAFQKGLAAFIITRMLLGLCESGFIPAGLYTITRWYKRNETSKRFAWFYVGNFIAQAISGLTAYGILQMDGVANLTGWQWLFIIEGLIGMVVGILFVTLFPKSTSKPTNLFGYSYFTEREAQIITQRVLLDDPTKQQARPNITKEEIISTLTNWKLYPHIIMNLTGLAPSSTVWSYAPTLINYFGYPRLKSNAMMSIGQWIQLVVTPLWGFAADKVGMRGPLVIAGLIMWWAWALGCRLVVYSSSPSTRFALLTLAIAFVNVWQPVNGSWMALNAPSAGARSVTLAVFIMSCNMAGIIGSQLFQAKDAPAYPVGWTVIISLTSVALVFSFVTFYQYWALNKHNAAKRDQDESGEKVQVYHL